MLVYIFLPVWKWSYIFQRFFLNFFVNVYVTFFFNVFFNVFFLKFVTFFFFSISHAGIVYENSSQSARGYVLWVWCVRVCNSVGLGLWLGCTVSGGESIESVVRPPPSLLLRVRSKAECLRACLNL